MSEPSAPDWAEFTPARNRSCACWHRSTPLVQTPREAKRLVNLYRLVRSTRDLRPASQFLGDDEHPGEYEAVVILLGLVSGHSQSLRSVLVEPPVGTVRGGLMHRPRETRWSDFAAGLEPKKVRTAWRNGIVARIADTELASWRQLHTGLAPATALVGHRNLDAFQYWAPHVARFSFLLSPFGPEDSTPVSRADRLQVAS